jgi:hypothetical protein
MPGSLRKASSEPLRHVTLKKHSGLRTILLGPFLLACCVGAIANALHSDLSFLLRVTPLPGLETRG